nr:MAG TPA: hypothetical protein [Bacteriophage sp.]
MLVLGIQICSCPHLFHLYIIIISTKLNTYLKYIIKYTER